MIDRPAPTRTRRALLLVALAALVVALVPVAAAQARVPKVFFGIDQGGTVTAPDYEKMHSTKVRTFRLAINWKRVEPRRGVYHWGEVDTKVSLLAQNEIAPAMFVFGSPQWATGSGNQGVPPLEGSALSDWKAFLKKAVKRYKKGGQFWRKFPGLPVKAAGSWQIWNEPNIPKYFARVGPYPPKSVPHAPKAYAKFVKASDKAIHRADKHAKVILAGLTGKPKHGKLTAPKFIKTFLRVKGITKHFDAAALHPYAPNPKRYKQRVSQFRKALNRGGAKRKQIWLTEVGWGSESNGRSLNKGLRGQAKMLKKSFKLTLTNRKRWKIDRLYWFDWRDPVPGQPASCSFCPSSGLLRYDRTTKPAYNSFKRFAKQQGRGRHRRHRHG